MITKATWCQKGRCYRLPLQTNVCDTTVNVIYQPRPWPQALQRQNRLNLVNREHRGEHWRRFKRDWTYYELSARIHREDPKIRVASLLNVIGSEAVDMYDSFDWDAPEDADNIDIVLQKFDERLSLRGMKHVTVTYFFIEFRNLQRQV